MTSFSLAQLTVLNASPPELIRIAAASGYQHVGLRLLEVTGGDAWSLVSDPQLLRETRRAMSDTGVGVLDVELVRLTPDFTLEPLRPTLDIAASLGARHILTQAHDDERTRLVHNFGSLCDLLASYSLTADVEFLTWTRMRGVREVLALLQTANRANAGMVIDTLHFFRSGCRIEELRDIPPELFHFIQISDAPAMPPTSVEGLIFAARHDRLDPGSGELDLRGLLLELPADIPIAVEIPNSRRAATMSDTDRAREALVATKALIVESSSARALAQNSPN
jgi:sugar phosphate isomerase/epimerase